MLAQLNHPNIAAIHTVEEAEGRHFLVMELVPGETLRERIKRGSAAVSAASGSQRDAGATSRAVPLEEALNIAKQIAEALEHAHEKPIIHRDLKPANVKVTPEGKVKVLDFGLAKAFAGADKPLDPADIPTGSQPDTLKGTILGTPAYMSPEEASGKATDKRTDIWALGCVLYELLTGKRAFEGETVTEIIASVLKSEPDWSALPASTPSTVRNLLRRCLQKEPKRRLRDAADVQIEIEEALAAPTPETTRIAKAVRPIPLWRRVLQWGVAVMLAAAVGIAAWTLKPTLTTPVTRFTVSLPPGENLPRLADGRPCPSIAVSPDGSLLAYISARGPQFNQQLYLRTMDSLEAAPVPGGAGSRVFNPFFSPNGQWLTFWVNGEMRRVPTSGGAPVTVGNAPPCLGGAAWGADDTIVFGASQGLLQIPAEGGVAQEATLSLSAGDQRNALFPEFLPGGNALLFTIHERPAIQLFPSINFEDDQIVVQRLDTGERRVLIQGGSSPHYVPTGHLVFSRAGTIVAVPFDLKRLEVTGGPVTLVQGLARSTDGFSHFSVSQSGALAYISGGSGQIDQAGTLVWADRKGTAQPLGAPPGAYRHPQFSPDGRHLALTVGGQKDDIWVYDISRGTLTRLTFEGDNSTPLWTPDGKRIAYRSVHGTDSNFFWKLADGTGAEEQIANIENFNNPGSISSDGKLAFYHVQGPKTKLRDIWTVPLEGERKPSPFLQTPFNEAGAKISPDGRWLAHTSDESGRGEIYVRAFPGPGGKWQISTEGGEEPLWARNGRELFYRTGDKMMAVDITAQPSFQAALPGWSLKGSTRDCRTFRTTTSHPTASAS